MSSKDTTTTEVRSTIDTAELRTRLADPALTIVDVRPLTAYNGWRVGDDARGGHIPGAVAFPAAWLDGLDAPEVERQLTRKGIVAGREIAVYGQGVDDARSFVTGLSRFGIDTARVHEDGFGAWAADPSLPVDKLA